MAFVSASSFLPFTTMSSTHQLLRLRHPARLFPSSPVHPIHAPSQCTTVFTRRAMMSALRSPPPQQQQPQRRHVPTSPSPLPETTPVVLPEGTTLSNDAASPQVAARPPPAPKAEKPRPRIRSTKAALTIVSALDLSGPPIPSAIHVHTSMSIVFPLRSYDNLADCR